MNFDLKTEAEESIKFFTTHLEKLRKFKEITKIAETTFTKISTEIELSDLNSLGELIDLSSLITISHLDLIIANQAIYYSKSDWEKIYFIKNIYLTIFEIIQKLQNFSTEMLTPFLNNKEIVESKSSR